jgi:hypothetical protein
VILRKKAYLKKIKTKKYKKEKKEKEKEKRRKNCFKKPLDLSLSPGLVSS